MSKAAAKCHHGIEGDCLHCWAELQCRACRGRGVVNVPGPFQLRTGIPCVGVVEECICGECNGTGKREP